MEAIRSWVVLCIMLLGVYFICVFFQTSRESNQFSQRHGSHQDQKEYDNQDTILVPPEQEIRDLREQLKQLTTAMDYLKEGCPAVTHKSGLFKIHLVPNIDITAEDIKKINQYRRPLDVNGGQLTKYGFRISAEGHEYAIWKEIQADQKENEEYFKLSKRRDAITIGHNGLYTIHAQIIYHADMVSTGFSLVLRREGRIKYLADCVQTLKTSAIELGLNALPCSLSVIQPLEAGDELILKEMPPYGHTLHLDLEQDIPHQIKRCFWRVIKIDDL